MPKKGLKDLEKSLLLNGKRSDKSDSKFEFSMVDSTIIDFKLVFESSL